MYCTLSSGRMQKWCRWWWCEFMLYVEACIHSSIVHVLSTFYCGDDGRRKICSNFLFVQLQQQQKQQQSSFLSGTLQTAVQQIKNRVQKKKCTANKYRYKLMGIVAINLCTDYPSIRSEWVADRATCHCLPMLPNACQCLPWCKSEEASKWWGGMRAKKITNKIAENDVVDTRFYSMYATKMWNKLIRNNNKKRKKQENNNN